MQVTLTHINGKPIQDRRQVRVINTVKEFEECVNECCRLPDNERWFSTCRVERLRRNINDSLSRGHAWYGNACLAEWLDIVYAKLQELDAKIALLELAGQL